MLLVIGEDLAFAGVGIAFAAVAAMAGREGLFYFMQVLDSSAGEGDLLPFGPDLGQDMFAGALQG